MRADFSDRSQYPGSPRPVRSAARPAVRPNNRDQHELARASSGKGVQVSVKRLLLMSGACGVLATAVSSALAQDVSEVAEVVIVTGSYIRGTAEDAALPVDVISAEDLAKQGAPTHARDDQVADRQQRRARRHEPVRRARPGLEGSGSVNLRGFGPPRTLVLLNGRRMVNNPFTGAVDTNLIPTAAIGRVEVLKDGAAATYGSDAIGGVVNFITKAEPARPGHRRRLQGDRGLGRRLLRRAPRTAGGSDRSSVSAGRRLPASIRTAGAGSRLGRARVLRQSAGRVFGGGQCRPRSSRSDRRRRSTGLRADPQCAALGGVPTHRVLRRCVDWQYTRLRCADRGGGSLAGVRPSTTSIMTDSTTLHIEALYAETEVPIYRTSPSYAALQTPNSFAARRHVPVPGDGAAAALLRASQQSRPDQLRGAESERSRR